MDINYNGQSVKNLIHKLTKYQTLHARAQSQSSLKARVYEAKVNEYVEKLRSAGVKNVSMVGGVNLEELKQQITVASTALQDAIGAKKGAYAKQVEDNTRGEKVEIKTETLADDIKAIGVSSQGTIEKLKSGVHSLAMLNLQAAKAMKQGTDNLSGLNFNNMPVGSGELDRTNLDELIKEVNVMRGKAEEDSKKSEDELFQEIIDRATADFERLAAADNAAK